MLVAGDISLEGDRIALRRGFNEGAWMWERRSGESIEETLTNEERKCQMDLEYEEQGEAIAFILGGEGFYTTSEGEEQPIYFYEIQ